MVSSAFAVSDSSLVRNCCTMYRKLPNSSMRPSGPPMNGHVQVNLPTQHSPGGLRPCSAPQSWRSQNCASRYSRYEGRGCIEKQTLGGVRSRGLETQCFGACGKRTEPLEAFVVSRSLESPSDYSLNGSLLLRRRVTKRRLPNTNPVLRNAAMLRRMSRIYDAWEDRTRCSN